MKKSSLFPAVALAVLTAAASLAACSPSRPVEPSRTVAARASEIDDPRVRDVLARSCSGCHADRRRDPWYARLVPSSWSSRGREALNFSDWESYDPERRRAEISLIAAVVADGSMPLVDYAFVVPSSRPSDDEKRRVAQWARDAALPAHGKERP